MNATDPKDKYIPWSWGTISRELPCECRIEGHLRKRYTAKVPTAYLDTETGEIVLPTKLPRGSIPRPIWLTEAVAIRESILRSLRKETREFARFVLQFRNGRRGITPGASELAGWYAKLHARRGDNVKRLIPKLLEVGILESDTVVGRYFQFAGRKLPAKYHTGEEVRAAVRLAIIQSKTRGIAYTRDTPRTNSHTELEFLTDVVNRFRSRPHRPLNSAAVSAFTS